MRSPAFIMFEGTSWVTLASRKQGAEGSAGRRRAEKEYPSQEGSAQQAERHAASLESVKVISNEPIRSKLGKGRRALLLQTALAGEGAL